MGNFSFSISLLTAMKNLTLPKNKKSDVDPVVHALTAHRQIAACDNDGTCFPFAYVAFMFQQAIYFLLVLFLNVAYVLSILREHSPTTAKRRVGLAFPFASSDPPSARA
jgi:Leucine-rich repeat (LRR) protein